MITKIFSMKSLFWKNLPYNIQWKIKNVSLISSYLLKNPIVLADIGARGGSLGELENLKEYINYVGFDADKKEAELLSKNPPEGFSDYKIFPYFVGRDKEEVEFKIYNLPNHCSVYDPGDRHNEHFGFKTFYVKENIKLNSSSLDKILLNEKIEMPDIIKLDTQGNELIILENSPVAVENALIIETEFEFIEMYKNQPLFFDISKYLYEKGFELVYINRVFHNRSSYIGDSRGQLIWGDGLFVRREDKLANFDINRIIKMVVLLINYGHLDIAYSIILKNPKILEILPEIKKYFKPYSGSLLNKVNRVLHFQFDKILAILLLFRKSSKSIYESDRQWPIR